MKRLTIGVKACTEIMGLLVSMAWADGELLDEEKDGLKGAAEKLNLEQELRDRLEFFMTQDRGFEDVDTSSMSVRDREFAYVACAWMARVDQGVADEEKEVLEEIGKALEIGDDRRKELALMAGDLDAPESGDTWSDGLVKLFKTIIKSIEQVEPEEEIDVTFE
jgi:hypothetical protein